MQQVLIPMVVIGIPFLGLVYIIRIYTNYILKKNMIEKGFVNEEAQALFREQKTSSSLGSLKWGILMITVGIALVVSDFLPFSYDSTAKYGIIAAFVGIGFLVYYQIAKKISEKE